MGICSTTYGDLVCRGCKRFAHEIVEWNGYSPDQRETIWSRLEETRSQAVTQAFMIVDVSTYLSFCRNQNLSTTLAADGLYDVLTELVRIGACLSSAGLREKEVSDRDPEALTVMRQLDRQIYARALAMYERNFRISQT